MLVDLQNLSVSEDFYEENVKDDKDDNDDKNDKNDKNGKNYKNDKNDKNEQNDKNYKNYKNYKNDKNGKNDKDDNKYEKNDNNIPAPPTFPKQHSLQLTTTTLRPILRSLFSQYNPASKISGPTYISGSTVAKKISGLTVARKISGFRNTLSNKEETQEKHLNLNPFLSNRKKFLPNRKLNASKTKPTGRFNILSRRFRSTRDETTTDSDLVTYSTQAPLTSARKSLLSNFFLTIKKRFDY